VTAPCRPSHKSQVTSRKSQELRHPTSAAWGCEPAQAPREWAGVLRLLLGEARGVYRQLPALRSCETFPRNQSGQLNHRSSSNRISPITDPAPIGCSE